MSEEKQSQNERPVSEELIQHQTELLNKAGIGIRVIQVLQRLTNSNDFLSGGAIDGDLKMYVQKLEDKWAKPESQREYISIVVKFPCNNVPGDYATQVFGVEQGRGFGFTDDPPLTEEQFDLVEKLANETGVQGELGGGYIPENLA